VFTAIITTKLFTGRRRWQKWEGRSAKQFCISKILASVAAAVAYEEYANNGKYSAQALKKLR